MLDKLNEFTKSHGALQPGRGYVTGVIALSLAILCFLGVLAFHFPEYLTTPQLRKSYDVETLRKVLFAAMVIAGGLSLVNILFNRSRWLSSFAFLLVALSGAAGRAQGGSRPQLSRPQEALDKNYAAHFAFLDYLFGTAVKSSKLWPQAYGVLGDYVPNGFLRQFKFPFTWKP